MKIIELKESAANGNSDPLNVRYFADGKRITREVWRDFKNDPRHSIDTFYTESWGGVTTFCCSVRIPY